MQHLRFAKHKPASGALHCFVLDCSASMLARGQLALAKGLLIALFDRARAGRAEVALIAFGGARAELRFGPAVPRWWNERWIEPIGGGGGTPLETGMQRAAQLLETARRREPAREHHLWLFSDGRVTQWPARPRHADQVRVIDCEAGALRVGRCEAMAQAWGAECLDVHALLT